MSSTTPVLSSSTLSTSAQHRFQVAAMGFTSAHGGTALAAGRWGNTARYQANRRPTHYLEQGLCVICSCGMQDEGGLEGYHRSSLCICHDCCALASYTCLPSREGSFSSVDTVIIRVYAYPSSGRATPSSLYRCVRSPLGFLSQARISSRLRVLITCAAVAPPLRAMPTPYATSCNPSGLWASGLMLVRRPHP
jgi:hypothetical protein